MADAPTVLALCTKCGVFSEGEAPSEHAVNCPEVTRPPSGEDDLLAKRGNERPPWDEYFLNLARLVSTRSTCPRAHIGCVIVDPGTHWVLATGYNGADVGDPHCTDEGCLILADHCIRALHAEDNAASQLLIRESPDPDETYVAYVVGPRAPCSHCASSLYQAGVRDVRWSAV